MKAFNLSLWYQVPILGWKTMVVWECELRKSTKVTHKLAKFLGAVVL